MTIEPHIAAWPADRLAEARAVVSVIWSVADKRGR